MDAGARDPLLCLLAFSVISNFLARHRLGQISVGRRSAGRPVPTPDPLSARRSQIESNIIQHYTSRPLTSSDPNPRSHAREREITS
jgi:hypothetical protein